VEARKLLDDAPCDPETRKIMRRAFDEAWVVITLHFDNTQLPDDCRVSLAHIVLAQARGRKADELRDTALAAILPTLKNSN
jgi:hypothetical protein